MRSINKGYPVRGVTPLTKEALIGCLKQRLTQLLVQLLLPKHHPRNTQSVVRVLSELDCDQFARNSS